MAGIIDFFTQDTVDGQLVATLAGVIEKGPKVPSMTKDMGLYSAEPIMGTTLKFDTVGSTIQLVQSSERGTDAPTRARKTKGIVHFEAVRIALEAKFMADEVLNMRKLGTGGDFEAAESYFLSELAPYRGSVQATLESHRVGGMRGYVLDADGDVITDLWTKFGLTAPAEVGFQLDAASSTVADPIRRAVAGVVRQIKHELGNIGSGQIMAACGSDFFDALSGAEEVRATYLNQMAAAELRGGTAMTGRTLNYGGAIFFEFEGRVGDTDFVEADEVRFFPAGVPGLFRQFFAPHDRDASIPGKNIGQPEYALPHFDPKGRFREVEIQSNPITICTRPSVLIGGRAGSVVETP